MPRDTRAYLRDVIDAIDTAVRDIDLGQYRSSRLIRSAVEREFILIGEATAALRRHAPAAFQRITDGPRIIEFRNQLTHVYVHVNDAVVWGVIERNLTMLRSDCAALLSELELSTDHTERWTAFSSGWWALRGSNPRPRDYESQKAPRHRTAGAQDAILG